MKSRLFRRVDLPGEDLERNSRRWAPAKPPELLEAPSTGKLMQPVSHPAPLSIGTYNTPLSWTGPLTGTQAASPPVTGSQTPHCPARVVRWRTGRRDAADLPFPSAPGPAVASWDAGSSSPPALPSAFVSPCNKQSVSSRDNLQDKRSFRELQPPIRFAELQHTEVERSPSCGMPCVKGPVVWLRFVLCLDRRGALARRSVPGRSEGSSRWLQAVGFRGGTG